MVPSPASQSSFIFPKRTIHLDFHTGPLIPDVGRDFDPDSFAATFKRAHVDSVTVFAKCHHGHLYFDTGRPERHPSLPRDLNLLELQIEALHRAGIRAPIYLSVQCDEYAANTHPEWIALSPELRHVKWSDARDKGSNAREPLALSPGWQILDMSSPYQDFLADQLQEVLDRFAPTDGLFLDMCWDQPSSSKWAIEGMTRRGLDPRRPEDHAKYARQVAHAYLGRFRDMVETAHRYHPPVGIWFNSRPKTQLHLEKEFLRHVEIECLPTGGWGYAFFPYVARFVRAVSGLPTLSHTGRFFKGWGDNSSLKPGMALKYECCQILSQGMTGGIGDLLHPRGVPDAPVYDLIGEVYAHIEACEPFCQGTALVSQIALVVNPELGDAPGAANIGAVRALQQLQHQFDIVPPQQELSGYELVLVPESTSIDGNLREKLRNYLQQGGALMIFGAAAFDQNGEPVLAESGLESHGESPFLHTFLHANREVSDGLADYRYVMYERGFRVTPANGAQTLVHIGEPYFERTFEHFSGHEYTPENAMSPYAAAVQNGRVITFAVPLLEAYGKHAAPNYRILLGNCIRLLLPQPLVAADGPTRLETTVMRGENRTVVHLLSFSVERRTQNLDIVEDALPLVEMPVRVQSERLPQRVFLAPDERDLEFCYENGIVQTQVTVLDGHAMLVIQH